MKMSGRRAQSNEPSKSLSLQELLFWNPVSQLVQRTFHANDKGFKQVLMTIDYFKTFSKILTLISVSCTANLVEIGSNAFCCDFSA